MPRNLFVAAFCCLLATPCIGNNSYFIPGDAFFYFELEEAEWNALKSGELTVVNYDRPEEMSFTFCGYAGYKTLSLTNLSDAFREHLIDSIAAVKEKYPTKIIEIDHGKPKFIGEPSGIERKEINKLRIFVYNRSFDVSQYRIGLKYNESWADKGVELGFDRDHFVYDFFVPTPQGIAESWRMGPKVSPLNAQFPELDRGYVTTPMSFDPAEIAFVVCPPVPLTNLCFPPRDAKLECFVVTESKTVAITNDKSKSRKSIWITQ